LQIIKPILLLAVMLQSIRGLGFVASYLTTSFQACITRLTRRVLSALFLQQVVLQAAPLEQALQIGPVV
jgi:hypothetical protein